MKIRLRNAATGKTYDVPEGSSIEILDDVGGLATVVTASKDTAAVFTPGDAEFHTYASAYGLAIAKHTAHKI